MMSVRQLASASLFTALISIGSRIMIPLDDRNAFHTAMAVCPAGRTSAG